MVKLILSTQSFLAYLIVIIKVLESRFSYKREEIKKHTLLIGISDPNYKNTWRASLNQKVYSIMQNLRSAAIIFFNRPTAKDNFF